jgi:hypothetical protein
VRFLVRVVFVFFKYERYSAMQQISPPAGNGKIDTILVQAEGSTGVHSDRKGDFNESMAESGEGRRL